MEKPTAWKSIRGRKVPWEEKDIAELADAILSEIPELIREARLKCGMHSFHMPCFQHAWGPLLACLCMCMGRPHVLFCVFMYV
jgi:hypothetical protein